VSLSWRNRVHVLLARERVALGRLGRGYGDTLKSRHVQPCSGAAEPAAGRSAWDDAMRALDAALRAFDCRRAEATVILSNAFARFQVVPWHDQIGWGAERGAYVRHGFQRVYGDDVRGWDVRVSDEGHGAPAVAAAVDRDLLAAISGAARQHGIAVVSVQPYLMWAINRWRTALRAGDFCLALVETGEVCTVLRAGGSWRAVKVAPMNGREPQAFVGELVERELCLAGLDPERIKVYVRAPQQGGFEMRSDGLPPCTVLGESGRAPGMQVGDALFAAAAQS